jgi:hypothetical protein
MIKVNARIYRIQILIVVMMLYIWIEVTRNDISRTLSVYANQTVSLPDVKITSHVQGQLVPTGMLAIMGVSSDNSSSVCDVYIILNEIGPYQRVYPAGSDVTGNNRLPNDDDMDNEDTDYKSSITKNEYDDFLQGLHDRVFDQVTEQLRRSGIDFPP